jgi:hypothetical protein
MSRRDEIKALLRGVLREHLAEVPHRAFLFGSQANQTELKRADFDVGLLPEVPIPEPVMSRLLAAIEDLPMLYPVDVVDFSRVRASFRQIALQNTEPL